MKYHIEKINHHFVSFCIESYDRINGHWLHIAVAFRDVSRLGRSVPCSSDPGRNAGTKGHSLGEMPAPAVGAAKNSPRGSTEKITPPGARWYTTNFNHGIPECDFNHGFSQWLIPWLIHNRIFHFQPCGWRPIASQSIWEPPADVTIILLKAVLSHQNQPCCGTTPCENHVQMDTPPLPSNLIWRFASDISSLTHQLSSSNAQVRLHYIFPYDHDGLKIDDSPIDSASAYSSSYVCCLSFRNN